MGGRVNEAYELGGIALTALTWQKYSTSKLLLNESSNIATVAGAINNVIVCYTRFSSFRIRNVHQGQTGLRKVIA